MTDEMGRGEPGVRPGSRRPEDSRPDEPDRPERPGGGEDVLPFDPADKTEPAEGGRDEVDESLERSEPRESPPD